MADAFVRTPSGLWSPQRKTAVARNLLAAFSQANPTERALGNRFYPDWNEDAHYLASKAGITPEHGASMLARLSPQTEAEMNRMMGYQLLSVNDRQTQFIHEAADLSHQASVAKKGSRERQALQVAAGKARARAALQGTPLNLQSSVNISEALRHRNGESPDPLSTLGDVKIGDFGHAIVNPWADRQVIDTHYHDAGVGRTDIPYDYNRGLGAKGRYENFQDSAGRAYGTAVRTGMLDPSVTPPNGMMGGIWYHQQQKKVESNPRARKARLASESRIANFLSASGSSAWDPAAHGQRPALSHTVISGRRQEEEEPTGRDRDKAEAKTAAIGRAIQKKRGMPTASDLGNAPFEGWG